MPVLGLGAAIASSQHGAVSLAQLLDVGATRHAITWAVACGELTRAAPAVFVASGSPRTWRQALAVAVLDAGDGACVSHRAAAILLGIARRDQPELVEVTSPRSRSHRLEGVILHRPLDLDPERDVVLVDGIPCTGPLRTLVDLG